MTPEQLDEIEAQINEFGEESGFILPLVKALREAWARCETLRDLADQMAYSAGLSARRMGQAQQARDEARAEVKRLRDLIDTVIRNCMECYDKRECQSCAWLREGTEKKR